MSPSLILHTPFVILSGVIPACHNAEDAVTISGPVESVNKFVEELKSEGVFARMVKTGGIAFHSKAMLAVAPQFKKELEKVKKLKLNIALY